MIKIQANTKRDTMFKILNNTGNIFYTKLKYIKDTVCSTLVTIGKQYPSHILCKKVQGDRTVTQYLSCPKTVSKKKRVFSRVTK